MSNDRLGVDVNKREKNINEKRKREEDEQYWKMYIVDERVCSICDNIDKRWQ